MKPKDWWQSLSFFWKIFGFIFFILVLVVGLVEGLLEPLAEHMLERVSEGFKAWHEFVLWAISILIPALASAYLLSKMLASKLNAMTKASQTLARGIFQVRLPVKGNPRDPFDLLSKNFNNMADAIEHSLRNERRLLADISHELRSPLTRLSIAIALLEQMPRNTELAAIALRLEKEANLMGGLIGILLDQGRERSRTSDAMEKIALGDLLEELAEDFHFQTEAQDKRVELHLPGDLTLYGNRMILHRMFENILSNAVFYSPHGGRIHVSAQQAEEEIQVRIRDFGPGVPEDQLEDIFRAFYRVDSSRTRASGGAGLGLALVKDAVLVHGGTIFAENANPGLQITIFLPIRLSSDPS